MWTHRGTALRMLRPKARSSRGPDLRQKGARAVDKMTTERGRKLHLPKAAKLPRRVGKRGEPAPSARPHGVGEVRKPTPEEFFTLGFIKESHD